MLRVYFRDAERFNAQQVQKSERFARLGQRIMLSMHFLAISFDQPDIIKAYARQIVLKHRNFKLDPDLWHEFFNIWASFLASKHLTNKSTRNAWQTVGKIFADECVRYTWEIGP